MDLHTRKLDLEQRRSELYTDMCATIEDERRAAYAAEFGPEFIALYPFKPSGLAIHLEALRRLAQQ